MTRTDSSADGLSTLANGSESSTEERLQISQNPQNSSNAPELPGRNIISCTGWAVTLENGAETTEKSRKKMLI